MENKEKIEYKTVFNKKVRIRGNQLDWIKKHKDTKTIAGFLDKIINQFKNGRNS